jgi:hypothetical protein
MNKLHDITGFHAYWIYVAVKNIHFGTKKYNIMESRLPQKKRFLKSWNDGRKDRDGMMFLKIMEKIPANKVNYIRLFAAYAVKNPSFHVSDILNDNFQTYKQNQLELEDIIGTVKSDYLHAILYCYEKGIQPEDMFYGRNNGYTKLPLIYKLYDRKKISANSLIAFNEVFWIKRLLIQQPGNIVEERQIKDYQLIFDKYSPIVYNHFKDINWKEKLQNYHQYIMKYGK